MAEFNEGRGTIFGSVARLAMRRCSTAVVLERVWGGGQRNEAKHNFSCGTGEFLVQMGDGHRKRNVQGQSDKTRLCATRLPRVTLTSSWK